MVFNQIYNDFSNHPELLKRELLSKPEKLLLHYFSQTPSAVIQEFSGEPFNSMSANEFAGVLGTLVAVIKKNEA
ncbi:hypothetical protein M2404_004059 [Rheinheimera pacifica]|uniref:hypothetical protein n=1 Tax=Rheinheimera pacifica TaxID=173990 RepID=UPI0021698D5F|nr:hypothetical protein [Rheinheimera pacifica]MCS4309682.1 hypothetical protein [Rheinheimera pacifica]